jgi:hypothetical protein
MLARLSDVSGKGPSYSTREKGNAPFGTRKAVAPRVRDAITLDLLEELSGDETTRGEPEWRAGRGSACQRMGELSKRTEARKVSCGSRQFHRTQEGVCFPGLPGRPSRRGWRGLGRTATGCASPRTVGTRSGKKVGSRPALPTEACGLPSRPLTLGRGSYTSNGSSGSGGWS